MHTCNWCKSKNKGTARNPSFGSLASSCPTLQARLICVTPSRLVAFHVEWYGKEVGLTERCIFVIFVHMSCSSPCILFPCVSPVFYFLVYLCMCLVMHLSIQLDISCLCVFLLLLPAHLFVHNWAHTLPAFLSTCLPVYLSTYLPTYLPIYHRPIYDVYIHSSFNRSLADVFICVYFVVRFSVYWFINPSFVSWYISQHLVHSI